MSSVAHVLGDVPSVIDFDVNSKEVTRDGWHAILVMPSHTEHSSHKISYATCGLLWFTKYSDFLVNL